MIEMGFGPLPIVISLAVGLIGLIGVASALVAVKGIGDERRKLERGWDALRDLPVGQSSDYRQWLNERQLNNTHFADHLLAAFDAANSGRSVSLYELQEVSARREARRGAGRLAGGVTGMLLVCGIAGTLFCIKAILGNFNINANPDGIFEAAESAQMATQLMQELSQGFLPSLVALVLTVFVALLRGIYINKRGVIAGELDHFDLEELFSRFPAPSISRDLEEVRTKLDALVTNMLTSQGNFDAFLSRLSDLVRSFRENGPSLKTASEFFGKATDKLVPKIDNLVSALEIHLGEDAPLCKQLESLDALAQQVSETTNEMKDIRTMMTGQLQSNYEILEKTVHACTEAAKALDAAVKPLSNAASSIHSADQSIRKHIRESIEKIAINTRKYAETINKEHREELKATVHNIAEEALSEYLKSSQQAPGVNRIGQRKSWSLINRMQNVGRRIRQIGRAVWINMSSRD